MAEPNPHGVCPTDYTGCMPNGHHAAPAPGRRLIRFLVPAALLLVAFGLSAAVLAPPGNDRVSAIGRQGRAWRSVVGAQPAPVGVVGTTGGPTAGSAGGPT